MDPRANIHHFNSIFRFRSFYILTLYRIKGKEFKSFKILISLRYCLCVLFLFCYFNKQSVKFNTKVVLPKLAVIYDCSKLKKKNAGFILKLGKYNICSQSKQLLGSNICMFFSTMQTLSKYIIWAPSSEFVSSSIPSWQILTEHAQPFRGARDLAFCLKVPLDSLLVWASSGDSGETARMRRLAWTFAARIGDKYQNRLTRPIWDRHTVYQCLILTNEYVFDMPQPALV